MKKIFALIFLSVVIFPSAVFAADTLLTPYWGPIVSCVGGPEINGPDGKIPTCTSLCDVFATAQNTMRLAVTIAIYIMVPIYFIYGGFRVATSGYTGDKISEIRKILGQTAIGVLIIICSFAIVNTIMNGISGIFGSSGENSSWLKIACVRIANPEELPPAVAGGAVVCTPACGATEECKKNEDGTTGCVPKEVATGDCPVTPIPAITNPAAQALEAAAPNPAPIWTSGDPASQANLDRLKIEFNKLKAELSKINASAQETSVYRPLAYQQHFYDIKVRYDQLIALTPEMLVKCDAIYKAVKFEAESKHGICKFSDKKCVVSPATATAVHTSGKAIDIKLTGIEYAAINAFMASKGIKLSWQGIPTDKVHFNLR